MMAKGKRRISALRRRARSAAVPPLPRTEGVTLIALSGTGVVTSAYLTYAHHRLINEPGWQSLCTITTIVDCDRVITSPFGAAGGVPLSAVALWFYLLTGGLAVAALARRQRAFARSPAVLLLCGGALAVLLSAGLAAVSILWIGAWCLLCMVLYSVNLGILVAAWLALRRTGEGIANSAAEEWLYWRRHRREAVRGVGMACAALAAVVFVSTRQWGGSSPVCRAVGRIAPDAPMTIVVYSDFQCPACRVLNGALRRLRDHPRLHIVARHYPLDPACNPRVQHGRHAGACLQARAAVCAAAQQQETPFSDAVFENKVQGEAGLVALAGVLGLDRQRFETCLMSAETAKRLTEEIDAAIEKGVRGTPTLFINGQRHDRSLSPEDLACLAAL